MSADNRVERFWLRLEQRFGDTLGVHYPQGIPSRVGDLVRSAENSQVKLVLSNLTNLRKPPTVREMEAAFGVMPIEPRTNPMPALVGYVMRNFALSQRQVRTQWTWLYGGDPRPGSQHFGIVGVRIPADEEEGKPELTVRVDEMAGA